MFLKNELEKLRKQQNVLKEILKDRMVKSIYLKEARVFSNLPNSLVALTQVTKIERENLKLLQSCIKKSFSYDEYLCIRDEFVREFKEDFIDDFAKLLQKYKEQLKVYYNQFWFQNKECMKNTYEKESNLAVIKEDPMEEHNSVFKFELFISNNYTTNK